MCYCDQLVYAMEGPLKVACQLGVFAPLLFVCHQRACSAKVKVVGTIWSVGFGSLPFLGSERYRLPLYASGGTGEPTVLVCAAVCFGSQVCPVTFYLHNHYILCYPLVKLIV